MTTGYYCAIFPFCHISCQRQLSPSLSTEAPFTNETFELSVVRPEVVYNLLRKLTTNKVTGFE